MPVEHRVTVAVAPCVVFAVYRRVPAWHIGDPDTKRASVDGPFVIGTRGRITPTKGNPVPMLLTEVVQDRCFTVESKIPFFRMRFEHELTPAGESTEVVHRVTFSGPLSLLLAPSLTRQLNAGLPVTLASLKALAETGTRAPG